MQLYCFSAGFYRFRCLFICSADVFPANPISCPNKELKLYIFVTQILSLARKITGLQDTEAAVKQFKANISSQDMYFNKVPIPANESGSEAFKLCNNIEGAMNFCPKRWDALQKWFKASREVSDAHLSLN